MYAEFYLFTGSNIKVRLSRNMCLLLTAILHFIHGMTDPVLMSLSASHVSSVRRHFPVLLVSIALFMLPVVLSYALWHNYALNTWLFAVTAFCVELCLKVRMHISFVAFDGIGYTRIFVHFHLEKLAGPWYLVLLFWYLLHQGFQKTEPPCSAVKVEKII